MGEKVKKLVPELRFSEFEGDWKKLSIEKIASVSSGGTPSRTEPTYWNGNIPWITTSETNQSEIFDSVEKITEKGLKNSSAKLFPKDTILMAMYGEGKTRGQVSLLRISAATSQNFAAIVLKKDYLPEFVYLFLSQEYERLRALSNGNAHQSLSSGLVKKYKVPVTSIKEQEKIASFLDSVALRITHLRRKHKLLETYKKGVMQKIFSQQIRFKQDDGKPFPDWEKKNLGDISYKISDGIHSTPEYDMNGEYFFINGNNLINNEIVFFENTKRINQDEFLKYKTDLSSQTILISINGTIGNLAFYNDEKIILGKSAGYINLNSEENKIYFFYLLQSSNIRRYFDKELTGSTIKNLSLKTIKNTNIFCASQKEQEKIANFLTSIDRKIEAVSLQIKKLEEFKKGLLQKMFV